MYTKIVKNGCIQLYKNTLKIVKNDSHSTCTTKIIQMWNNNLKEHTILYNFKSSLGNSKEANCKNLLFLQPIIYKKM